MAVLLWSAQANNLSSPGKKASLVGPFPTAQVASGIVGILQEPSSEMSKNALYRIFKISKINTFLMKNVKCKYITKGQEILNKVVGEDKVYFFLGPGANR